METQETNIPITVRRAFSRRARHLRLTVRPDGQAVLTVPLGAQETAIAKFLYDSRAWLAQQFHRLSRYKNHTFLPRNRREYLTKKEEARALVHVWLARYTDRYGFRYGTVSIKNLSRNWGSCSQLRNLNFNYKIALLPERLASYVVFHELCHLEIFNHSAAFWVAVAREFPDHKAVRRELRKYHP